MSRSARITARSSDRKVEGCASWDGVIPGVE